MLRKSVLLISVGSTSAASPQEKWADFIAKFGKTYTAPAEAARRFEVFKDNVDLIDAENAKDHTYELAINRFADLTLKEFSAQYMGSKPPAQIFGDLPYLGNHTWTGEALPASVDWRSKGAVTPVKNQGQCGSCWSFGTTGGLEGAWKIATGNLVPISEQMFVDCDHTDNGCGGGLPSNAYKFATTHDLCTESSYPYQGANGRCDMSRCEVAIPHGKVTGYKSLAHVQRLWPASEAAMMSAVAQQPVSVGIEADKEMFQFYKGGVLDGSCGASIDHAVLCVGYGTDPTAGDYWLIKNSWGVDHGEEGYWRLKRGKKHAWSDECGVLMMPSYPVIATDFVVV